MVLDLFWCDNEQNSYNIASLDKEDNVYILDINEQELKKATKHGCFGMGDIKFLKSRYVSKNIFPFFGNRIPSMDHPRIESILKQYNINKYDEMELLKATEARLSTDRYYCKEKC